MRKKTYQSGIETKERILFYSKQLFYEKGYENTLYNDISGMADINRALIPYHYKNKSILALAAYDSFIDEYVKTRNEISKNCTNAEKLVIGILYYYRLLDNRNVSRFVEYVIGENAYRERLLLGESIMYKNIIPENSRVTQKKWDEFMHMVWGMEVESIKLVAAGQYDDIRNVGKVMIQMVFGYFDYDKKKVNQLFNKVNRILDEYEYKVNSDFTIQFSKKMV